jgi:hypothetical protein
MTSPSVRPRAPAVCSAPIGSPSNRKRAGARPRSRCWMSGRLDQALKTTPSRVVALTLNRLASA